MALFVHSKLEHLNDFFLPLDQRPLQSVYFCRLTEISDEVVEFVKRYYDAARKAGVIIDGRIPNPDMNNLNYFTEIMGSEFLMDRNFLATKLQRWLPRMTNRQRDAVVTAVFSMLQDMQKQGKNENMLRNAYIKSMCWLYYKFERIIHLLGMNEPPKILYDGAISNYELQLLVVLSRAGADILLMDRSKGAGYLQLDPEEKFSVHYRGQGTQELPESFNLKWIQKEISRELERQKLYGVLPQMKDCTNAWMTKAAVSEVLTPSQARGTEHNFFYNSFIVQYGVEDKLTYASDLFSLYSQWKASKRNLLVVDGGIQPPTPEEIGKIARRNYRSPEDLAADISRNIQYTGNQDLQNLMRKVFIDLLLEEANSLAGNVLKLTNRAVYLLCWLKRYQTELFRNWKKGDIGIFVLFGNCATQVECLFLRMLAKLPVDVLVFLPNLNSGCELCDPSLLELRYEFSLAMEKFPAEQANARVQTAAYQAERELDALMYQDSGMYRNQQHAKASSVTLQPIYEELFILWDQELKYRPNFVVADETVTVPVLLEKVSGIKNGALNQYWQDVKKLMTPETTVVRSLPWISGTDYNPIKPYVTQFLNNGKLLKSKIKSHKAYQYGVLRNEIQDHMLDKLQLLLNQKLIRGTYQNGTEYTIIATVLNLRKELIRQIQSFDFTKKNPKLLIINTTEQVLSLEDSIVVAFLNLIGFDIVFFVPTGYQCIEKHFTSVFVNEHPMGQYMYDLTVPNFNTVQENNGFNPLRKLFGRSN